MHRVLTGKDESILKAHTHVGILNFRQRQHDFFISLRQGSTFLKVTIGPLNRKLGWLLMSVHSIRTFYKRKESLSFLFKDLKTGLGRTLAYSLPAT